MNSFGQSTFAPLPKGVTLFSRKPNIPVIFISVLSLIFVFLIIVYIKYILKKNLLIEEEGTSGRFAGDGSGYS